MSKQSGMPWYETILMLWCIPGIWLNQKVSYHTPDLPTAIILATTVWVTLASFGYTLWVVL